MGLRVVTGDRPFPFAGNASKAHQTRGLLTPNIDAVSTESMPHLANAVDSVIGAMNSTYMFEQCSVAKTAGHFSPRALDWRYPREVMKPPSRLLFNVWQMNSTQETIPVFIDELDHFLSLWVEF